MPHIDAVKTREGSCFRYESLHKDCLPPRRRICHTTSEKEITLENPLPDLSPDISRLSAAGGDRHILSRPKQGKDGVTVSGRVVFGLLYETDYKNKLAHASMTTDFAQRFVLDGFAGGALDTDVRVECLHVNCRLLSPRKVLLRCLLAFSMAATELRGTEVLSPEAKESDTFFQTTLIEGERWIDPVEAVYSFSERIDSPKPIGTILSKTLTLSPPEIVEREGVVVVNSNAHFTSLVEEENTDNAVFTVTSTFPISMEFNAPEGEHFHAELSVATLDASAELNDYGENKIMAVNFSVDARLKGYVNEPLELGDRRIQLQLR